MSGSGASFSQIGVKPAMSEKSTVAVSSCGRGRPPERKACRCFHSSRTTGSLTKRENSCISMWRSRASRRPRQKRTPPAPKPNASVADKGGMSGPPVEKPMMAPNQISGTSAIRLATTTTLPRAAARAMPSNAAEATKARTSQGLSSSERRPSSI